MNQEEIMKALDICTGDGRECVDCPLAVVPGCMNKLILEARKLIQSLLEKQTSEPCEEATPWTRQRVLKEAERCVCGQREQDYGAPEDSFSRIAEFWVTYKGVEFSPVDVAIMMALLKIARISENPQHMDSWVDLAGYAACGGEIARGGVKSEE